MTFEDVWNKIKAVRLTTVLGFYGNVVLIALAIAFFSIVALGVVLLVLKIFITIPWPYILLVFVVVSGYVCARKWGWYSNASDW